MATNLARKLRHNASEPERAVWRILWPFRQAGWHFRRQVQLGPHYVDFACLAAKLVVEVDGETHGSDEAISAEKARDAYMESRGILVLRFSNSDVLHNAQAVFAEIIGVLGAVSGSSNTPTPSLPAGGREHIGRASSSPSPLRGFETTRRGKSLGGSDLSGEGHGSGRQIKGGGSS